MPAKYIPRVLLAGRVSTFVMTFVAIPVWNILSLPSMDFASVIGAEFLKHPTPLWTSGWWFGVAEHFFNGAVLFPLVYAFLAYRFLPGESVLKGFYWGVILWFGWQCIMMPAVGLGLFSSKTPYPAAVLFITFNSHLIYGMLLGMIVGHPSEIAIPMETEYPIHFKHAS